MKIQKTLVAAVTLALAGAAYAGGDKNKSMTSAQGSNGTATQQQASSDTTLQSSTSAGQSASANGQSGSLDTQSAAANGQSSAQAGDESVRQMQQQLKDKGFDPGPIDGIDGPKTQAALRKSQEAGGTNAAPSTDASTSSQSSTMSSQPSTTSSQPSTESNSTAQPK